jgi:hypothetical protein
MADDVTKECTNKDIFYEELTKLKNNQKRRTSKTTLFIEDDFYEESKKYLKAKAEKETYDDTLTIAEMNVLKRKNWTLHDEKLKTKDRKNVIKKSELYDILVRAHQRTAHRGRQITSKWINDNYSEVNVRVVNLFVALCPIHEGNKTITSHVKLVTKPLQSPSFLSMIEIDLMDFRKCPCSCPKPHLWSMNIIDHHTKFVNVTPLHHKSAEEVLPSLRNYCYTYGFPKKIITDNGTEFRNKLVEGFCRENEIKIAHGAPRTPTTQGLTERSNRSWKEDMRAIMISSTNKKVKRWCSYTREAAYTRNISYHRAIKMCPYEAVFHVKPHREIVDTETEKDDDDDDLESAELDDEEIEMPNKRHKIIENQRKYNTSMIEQTKKRQRRKIPKFKVSDMVAVKIHKVDKTTPFHPNMLLGKIMEVEETGCVKIVTQYGIVNTLISETRLTPCTATNLTLDYNINISFTAACKKASGL